MNVYRDIYELTYVMYSLSSSDIFVQMISLAVENFRPTSSHDAVTIKRWILPNTR